ncbi:hypothetical protein F4561_002848 [Lipingzhangella halophila]|uniref:Uncharacterized protein n=1 Tax=Lipingzhangella halophila TaxID=1783352 RepID=A0A7W7RHE6_9ACTN|nr:hypothetical protein [Lipingzhangella halophila]MBB4932028.1 hypothetical protein [Lipingzhangella halophila]
MAESDLRSTQSPPAPEEAGNGSERAFGHGPALGRDAPNFAAEG